MNRLGTRLLLAMLVVAVVSLTVVPVAHLVAERVTFARLPPEFRERVIERTAPPPFFRPPPPDRSRRSGAQDAAPAPLAPAEDAGPNAQGGDEGPDVGGLREENLRLFTLFGDFRAAQRRAVLTGVALALLVCAALALWLSRSIARPLEAVSRAASRLARGDLQTRVAPLDAFHPRETRLLADGFNTMAGSLERLEGERKAMIADIAHELRTPLAAMSMRLEALEDGLVPFDASEIELLQGHTSLLARLIDDLRLLSLADAGRLTLNLEELDLGPWLRATRAYGDAVRRQGAHLEVRLPDEPVRVRADAQRLRQVLHNLVDNAVAATPEGGGVEVALEAAGDEVLLRVRDEGPGIPEEELETIFERFVQGRRRDTRGASGSGLGLAIVRTLVTLHGGRVTARNQAGGAEFLVHLPLVPGAS